MDTHNRVIDIESWISTVELYPKFRYPLLDIYDKAYTVMDIHNFMNIIIVTYMINYG